MFVLPVFMMSTVFSGDVSDLKGVLGLLGTSGGVAPKFPVHVVRGASGGPVQDVVSLSHLPDLGIRNVHGFIKPRVMRLPVVSSCVGVFSATCSWTRRVDVVEWIGIQSPNSTLVCRSPAACGYWNVLLTRSFSPFFALTMGPREFTDAFFRLADSAQATTRVAVSFVPTSSASGEVFLHGRADRDTRRPRDAQRCHRR